MQPRECGRGRRTVAPKPVFRRIHVRVTLPCRSGPVSPRPSPRDGGVLGERPSRSGPGGAGWPSARPPPRPASGASHDRRRGGSGPRPGRVPAHPRHPKLPRRRSGGTGECPSTPPSPPTSDSYSAFSFHSPAAREGRAKDASWVPALPRGSQGRDRVPGYERGRWRPRPHLLPRTRGTDGGLRVNRSWRTVKGKEERTEGRKPETGGTQMAKSGFQVTSVTTGDHFLSVYVVARGVFRHKIDVTSVGRTNPTPHSFPQAHSPNHL